LTPNMSFEKRIIMIALVTAAVIPLTLGLLIPLPAYWPGAAWQFYAPLAMSAAMACTHFGAFVLFLSGLRAYKSSLKLAYTLILISMLMAALGSVQLAIISGFNLWLAPWVRYGGIGVPYLLGGLLFYLGARQFGRLVEAKTWLLSVRLVLPLVIVLSLATIYVPHISVVASETALDIANALIAWSAQLDLVATLIMWRIRNQMGSHYTTALSLLTFVFGASALVLGLAWVHELITFDNLDLFTMGLDVIGVIVGLAWLAAGFAFARTREY